MSRSNFDSESHSHYALVTQFPKKEGPKEKVKLIPVLKKIKQLPFLYKTDIQVVINSKWVSKPSWEETFIFIKNIKQWLNETEPRLFIVSDFFYNLNSVTHTCKVLYPYEYGQLINDEVLITYMSDQSGGGIHGTTACSTKPIPTGPRNIILNARISSISVGKRLTHRQNIYLIPMLCYPDYSYMLNLYFCYGICGTKDFNNYKNTLRQGDYWGHNDLPEIDITFGVLCHKQIEKNHSPSCL